MRYLKDAKRNIKHIIIFVVLLLINLIVLISVSDKKNGV